MRLRLLLILAFTATLQGTNAEPLKVTINARSATTVVYEMK